MSINLTNLTNLTKIMLPAVRAEMQAILKADQHPPIDHLHGMMQYHMGWLDADFQQAGAKTGKHIRPLLLLLTVEAAGGAWTQAVPAAAAIELLHNFSLIHDDIEDNSPTRRGRETLWHIWGIPLAINAGDAMFAAAHLALGRLIERDVSAHIVVQAFRRFDETCIALTQGQHADMQFETRDDVQVEEYISMITGKTSVLLSLCAELGALIAGCEAETVAHYAQFGLNLGLAFQVQDDILGIWGDEALIGKSASSDIETRKKTLPVLYGLENTAVLRDLYQQPLQTDNGAEFVQKVVSALDASGARTFAEEQARHYSSQAVHHLQAAEAENTAVLEALTDKLLIREH